MSQISNFIKTADTHDLLFDSVKREIDEVEHDLVPSLRFNLEHVALFHLIL